MPFFKRKQSSLERAPAASQERTSVGELVDSVREHLHIEGKAPLDTESFETAKEAAAETARFLRQLGYEEAAQHMEGFVESGKVFFFDRYTESTIFGETGDYIEHDGFFSGELDCIGINTRLLQTDGQAGVYKTLVHELIHRASFFLDARGLRAVEREGGLSLRRQAGFDISTRRPGFEAGKGNAQHLAFLNEGVTETIASMVDASDWNTPQAYNVNRYYVQLFLRALVEHKRRTVPDYSLREAWQLLVGDYFENKVTFAKEMKGMLGKRAFQELARVPSMVPKNASQKDIEEALKQQNEVLFKVARAASMPIEIGFLYELREAPRNGSALARLKQMEDETRRAALSVSFDRAAA